MLTIHLDTSKLSDEELANVSHVLRCRCADCIEEGIAPHRRHDSVLLSFLDELATAIDRERHVRAGREPRVSHEADATGVP